MKIGWTHFWRREISLPDDRFRQAVTDCKKVVFATKVDLTGEDGAGDPVFAHSAIICEKHRKCSSIYKTMSMGFNFWRRIQPRDEIDTMETCS